MIIRCNYVGATPQPMEEVRDEVEEEIEYEEEFEVS